MKITAKKQYSGIVPGNQYKLVKEGKDYMEVRIKGASQCIPKWVFSGELDRRFIPREEEPEEFELGWDNG